MGGPNESITHLIRCWCCGATYPNPHKVWCGEIKEVVAPSKPAPKPKVEHKPRYSPTKHCALCRTEVKEGAFCSELCRSDAWRLFHREEENVRYSGSNRTRVFK